MVLSKGTAKPRNNKAVRSGKGGNPPLHVGFLGNTIAVYTAMVQIAGLSPL